MSYILEARDLCCAYEENIIIKHLNIALKKNGMTGILGPNGSGKTTLLRHLSGALKPLSGKVLLDGVEITSIRKRMLARKLAYVPQNNGVEFEFTAMETVMMGRMPYLKRFQQETQFDIDAVHRAMMLTGTWKLKNRSITELSGGELQRVMIARALAQQPEILMLDEPTAHLDLQFQMEILELLRRLTDSGEMTTIVVLHDINLAVQFCDDVIFMQNGNIITNGHPQDVITEKLINDVYHVAVSIWRDENTGAMCIAPIRQGTEGISCLKQIG